MRILIIEDNPLMSNSLARDLTEEGYSVDLAHDGEDGLYRASNWNYDCILLDLMIPVIDGVTLLKKLRGSKETPVMVISAKSDVRSRIDSLNVGADDYLPKPFDLEELLARLRSLIRRSKGRSTDVILVQDLKIDTFSRSVSKAGQTVKLTPKEYEILMLLVNRKGKTVTSEFIHDSLYGTDEDLPSNPLAVHIHSLRKKIGKEFVENVHGIGYKFVE